MAYGGMERIDVAQDTDRRLGACECGDEFWACINCGEFFDKLRSWLVFVLIKYRSYLCPKTGFLDVLAIKFGHGHFLVRHIYTYSSHFTF